MVVREPQRGGRTERGDGLAGGSDRIAGTSDQVGRLEDLVGGRLLGWAGGLAVLVGLVFLLVIAASRGWIGEEERVVMAAGTSLLLLGLGARLHERQARNEAAVAAAATGIA